MACAQIKAGCSLYRVTGKKRKYPGEKFALLAIAPSLRFDGSAMWRPAMRAEERQTAPLRGEA